MPRRSLPPISVLAVVGGAAWLAGFALLLTVPNALPLGYVSVAPVAMACGALLIGAAIGLMLVMESPATPRALGLLLLAASSAVMVFGLATLALIGDEDVLWAIDPELTTWWGLTAYMAVLAIVTALRQPRREVILAWGVAALGAAAQAVAYAFAILGIGIPPLAFAIPMIAFGAAWMTIGFGLLPRGRASHAHRAS